LAITFIGKLGNALADDLCGLAETMTMHGFARKFILGQCKNLKYYPRMYELIKEDLKNEGITTFKIGDQDYSRKSKYYKAVGDDDVIHYVVQIFKNDNNKIPTYDLILIDEYQDFNEKESELVDLLAQKNEIVIVGDDDQALYGFKGSSPSFIRKKYDLSNTYFESHVLRFCFRCTKIIIKYFHILAHKFNLNNPVKKRIKKDYFCYLPDKIIDSKINSKIYLIKKCPIGMIAYKIQKELEEMAIDQKIKDVLVIGESRTCKALLKTVAMQLKKYGFKNVDYRGDSDILNMRQNIIDAYKFIAKDESSLLGWRILGNPADEDVKKKHVKNSKVFEKIINGAPLDLQKIKDEDINTLEAEIEEKMSSDKEIRRYFLFQKIKRNNIYKPRPFCNFDITVCNTLNSKGLGADVVFLIGFDQGKFPIKKEATDSEVYQMIVSITRAKKRIYLINTVNQKVSSFIDCLDDKDLNIQEIKGR